MNIHSPHLNSTALRAPSLPTPASDRMCRPRRDEADHNSREQIPGLSQDDNFPLAQRGKHVTNAAESLAQQPRAINGNAKKPERHEPSRAEPTTAPSK